MIKGHMFKPYASFLLYISNCIAISHMAKEHFVSVIRTRVEGKCRQDDHALRKSFVREALFYFIKYAIIPWYF